MTDPTTDDGDALEAALRGMPRPVVDPTQRETHIASALDAFDLVSQASTTDASAANVVSLSSRRRRVFASLSAVAAAGLFAVGLGIGRASAPDAPAATVPVRNAASAPADSVVTSGAGVVTACPDLDIAGPAVTVTRFGTYVLLKSQSTGAGELVVVDTSSCIVVTRVDLSSTED